MGPRLLNIIFQANFQQIYRRSGTSDFYIYSLASHSLQLGGRGARTAELSPDGTMLGEERGGDLYVVDLASQREVNGGLSAPVTAIPFGDGALVPARRQTDPKAAPIFTTKEPVSAPRVGPPAKARYCSLVWPGSKTKLPASMRNVGLTGGPKVPSWNSGAEAGNRKPV